MKQSYYDLLGVENTAGAQQIKRAYYTLVKKYPPERFPEEYKELRAAYDTLSNEKKRADYDQDRSMPETAAYLFDQAKKLQRSGRYEGVAEIYEQILRMHPDLPRMQVELANAYEKQNKYGKAITVWEKLCKAEPENAEYAYGLAGAYEHRSWNRKAEAQYHRVLELDSGNTDCWVRLTELHLNSDDYEEARLVCKQGIDAIKERGKESVRLYTIAVMLYVDRDTKAAERYLCSITQMMRTGGDLDDNREEIVDLLLRIAKRSRKLGFVRHIREMAATLPYIGENMRKELDTAERVVELETLSEHGFSDLFYDLFATLLEDEDCEETRLDLMAIECNLLADIRVYRTELLRLRKEYPSLYAIHAAFFNEILAARDTQKLLYRRLKILSKKGLQPVNFMEEDDEEGFDDAPVQPVRTGPKIGRNDPCPCGSGKKYKKCCGQ